MLPIGRRRRAEAEAYLRDGLPDDLLLLDLVSESSQRDTANTWIQAMGVWEDDVLVGVGVLRPSVLLDSRIRGAAVEALCGSIEGPRGGLLKSSVVQVEALWSRLEAFGHRALLDRMESGLLVRDSDRERFALPSGGRSRLAEDRDLDRLVEMARASLREEGRPDPGELDPTGFRHWVRSRLPRARVLEVDGEVAFVGYADVARAEGWLVQGVYTMPHWRGQGVATAGMSALVDEAVEAGADHVQLTVIDGNEPALRLYARLGFRSYGRIRTILFS